MTPITIHYVIFDQTGDPPVLNYFLTKQACIQFDEEHENYWEEAFGEIETFVGSKDHLRAVENMKYHSYGESL